MKAKTINKQSFRLMIAIDFRYHHNERFYSQINLTKFTKGYKPPAPYQNHSPSPITRIPPFLKIPHPPILPVNWSSQVFLININATLKLSSINTIHVKQQHNIGFSIFKFILKYMLDNVYVNKIYARQYLYIIS